MSAPRPGALSAHIGYLFTGLALPDRLPAARAAGFDAVEHPAPFDIAARDMRAMLNDNALALAQITSGPGAPGEKGLAALPGREAEFRAGFARALDYAETAAAPFVHPMSGVEGCDTTYRANIEAALRMAEGRAPRVLIEAISTRIVPGYHMATLDALLALADDFPTLCLLIDSFHIRADGHDPAAAIRSAGARLGHVHFADFPTRAEPGSGEIGFAGLTAALQDIGYGGAIGFEYSPSGPDHLRWMDEFATDPALCAIGRQRSA